MSITNYFYTNISSNYSGNKLDLINEQNILDWDAYPLLISQTELKNIQLSHIMRILSKTSEPYSKIATSGNSEPCPCIRIFDVNYCKSIASYTAKLKIACNKDLKIINDLKSYYNTTNSGMALLTGYGAVMMSRLREKLPKGPSSSTAMNTAGLFCGAATGGYYISSSILTTYITRQGSLHRIKWLQQTNSLEKERLKAVKADIEQEHKKLSEELRELEEEGETDLIKAENLHQISELFSQLFPLEKLT